MAFKHVYAPTQGMITDTPSTVIPAQASPNIEAMKLKDGIASSDTGHIDFPTVGVLATNELNGTFMKFAQFYKTDGTSYAIALTTTNAYQYNTSTSTWDVITWGTEIDNCEAAWDAQANVTSTADTAVKLRGSKAAKHVIAAGFSTGIVSSEDDVQNADISDTDQHTHLSYWIYVSAAVAAGVLAIRLSEQATGGDGATYADYNVPAIVATTWTHVTVDITAPDADDGGTYPDDLNVIASVALIANTDPGAITVYLDDIRAVAQFTGDEDDQFSYDTYNDTFIVTNGIDQPMKYAGSGTFEELTTTLATGAITTSEIVLAFKDHIVLMNNTENAANTPQRVSWTNIGKLEDHTAGTSGYQDLVDDESWIVSALKMGENEVIIYKERSIVKMNWVGGVTPFRFETLIPDATILGKDSVVNIDGPHAVVGNTKIYVHSRTAEGSHQTKAIDVPIRGSLYANLNNEKQTRTFLLFDEKENELQVWIPTITDYPDEVWCLNVEKGNWYKKARTMMGYGNYSEQATLTIGDLTGTIGEQAWRIGDATSRSNNPIILVGDHNGKVYKLWIGSLNNDGSAITNAIETPDFTLPDTPEYMNKFMRVNQLMYEAFGQSVTTSWSNDGGATWNPTQGGGNDTQTLTGEWEVYQQDFDCVERKVRFRFRNNTASSGFHLRYYGFNWEVRSSRR